jgi:hypothetical protein
MLAVKYLFLTDDAEDRIAEEGEAGRLKVGEFDALTEQNDYEIPWSLRDLIADPKVAHFFYHEFAQLRDAFREWHPKTTILRDVKRKLQPITKLGSGSTAGLAGLGNLVESASTGGNSKL